MGRKLKIYGWQGMRRECPAAPNGSRQTREICAAPSMAAVARIMGEKSPRALFNLGETGNGMEIAQAMSEPGVVFWKPLNDYYGTFWARWVGDEQDDDEKGAR